MSLTNYFSLKKSHLNYFNLFCHALALAVMSVLQNHHRLINNKRRNKRLIRCRLQFVICTISCNCHRKLCLQIAGAGQALTNPLILYYCGFKLSNVWDYQKHKFQISGHSLFFFHLMDISYMFGLFFNNQISISNTYLTCLNEMKRNNENEKSIKFLNENLT